MSGKRRVLVCDDEPQVLRALTLVLSEAGFEVVPAAPTMTFVKLVNGLSATLTPPLTVRPASTR